MGTVVILPLILYSWSFTHFGIERHSLYYNNRRSPSVHPSTAVKAAFPRRFPIPSQSDTLRGTMMITLAQRVRSEYTAVTTIMRKMLPRGMAETMQLNRGMMTMPTITTIRMMIRTITPRRSMMMPAVVVAIITMMPPSTMPMLQMMPMPMGTTTM